MATIKSIEEKAKAYDEAIIKAKALYGQPVVDNTLLETIFPELAESEDERIRKGLIEFVRNRGGFKQEWISWLEKHGEQKSNNKVDLTTKSYITPNSEFFQWIYDRLIYVHHENPDVDYMLSLKERIEDMEKSTDKVEPKFKIGDFIVNDYCMGRIVEITKDAYLLDTEQGIPFSCHSTRLWTVQEAKDGDVLAFDDNTIVIFKDLYNATTFHSYCHIEDGVFTASEEGVPDWWEGEGFYPATKEQRDTLLKAIADAGYTFDFEKKELKKIESRQEELTEFEKAVKQVMEEAIECGDTHNLKADADMLLSLVQKPAWSEEDERMFKNIIALIETLEDYNNAPDMFGDAKFWLKSLKERVQPKQEWSEEDESHIRYLIECLEHCKKGVTLTMTTSTAQEYINWLKSIRPNRWKPSEEMLEALYRAIPENATNEDAEVE